jgi:uncharacterized protein YydD (DUF2326 family)
MLHPYQFNHPGLNTILAKKIKQNEEKGQNPVLGSDDLRECWLELIKEQLATELAYCGCIRVRSKENNFA